MKTIREFGPEIAQSIINFFEQKKNRQAIQNLIDVGIKLEKVSTKKKAKLPFENKTFVFTGQLEKYSRSQAQDSVEKLGANATSTVSGNTDYVVVGDNPGSKLDEAKKRNIKIIYENDFEKLLQN